jgi:hypothetical protein
MMDIYHRLLPGDLNPLYSLKSPASCTVTSFGGTGIAETAVVPCSRACWSLGPPGRDSGWRAPWYSPDKPPRLDCKSPISMPSGRGRVPMGCTAGWRWPLPEYPPPSLAPPRVLLYQCLFLSQLRGFCYEDGVMMIGGSTQEHTHTIFQKLEKKLRADTEACVRWKLSTVAPQKVFRLLVWIWQCRDECQVVTALTSWSQTVWGGRPPRRETPQEVNLQVSGPHGGKRAWMLANRMRGGN